MNQPQKALTSRLSSVLAGTSQCIYSPFLFFFPARWACWLGKFPSGMKSCSTWDVRKNPVKNGTNYHPQRLKWDFWTIKIVYMGGHAVQPCNSNNGKIIITNFPKGPELTFMESTGFSPLFGQDPPSSFHTSSAPKKSQLQIRADKFSGKFTDYNQQAKKT